MMHSPSLAAAVYLFLPGYVADSIPPLLARIPGLARFSMPLDCGRTWRGQRLLGDHKTWRGTLGAIIIAGLVFLVQRWLAVRGLVVADAPVLALPWWYGFLLGFGVIVLGDALESFMKRRLGVAPGKQWVPFDQIDFTLGAYLATACLFWPGWSVFALLVVLNAVLAALTHYGGFLLGVNAERL